MVGYICWYIVNYLFNIFFYINQAISKGVSKKILDVCSGQKKVDLQDLHRPNDYCDGSCSDDEERNGTYVYKEYFYDFSG